MKNELIKILATMPSEQMDEFAANNALAALRGQLTDLANGGGVYSAALVLVDCEDAFCLMELEVSPDLEFNKIPGELIARYYESGLFGPDSILLSVRRWASDGHITECPFDENMKPAAHPADFIIPTAVPVGAYVWDTCEIYESRALKHLVRCFRD